MGLLRAVYAFKREHISTADLAKEAFDLEYFSLGRPVGFQDQYIAAFGGVTWFHREQFGDVDIEPVEIPPNAYHALEDRLLLFFTGYSRNADEQLERQRQMPKGMLANLDEIQLIARKSHWALEEGNLEEFADLMNQHWVSKRTRSEGMSIEHIDRWYESGIQNGALGGKLVGAGGGGFLMFYAEHPTVLRAAMERNGLPEVRFRFDHDGSVVLVRD